MQMISLEKWVDELQAQIDQVKREVQSIPAPTPVTNPDSYVFSCGHATCDVTDTPVSESNDDEFFRFATANFTVTFDLDNYDYYISFDYASSAISGASYYGTMCCNKLLEAAPLSGDVFPVLSRTVSEGTESCAVAGLLNVNFNFDTDGVYLEFVSEYGDGTGIAPDETGITGFDYVIFAQKKPTDNSRTKKKSTKKK